MLGPSFCPILCYSLVNNSLQEQVFGQVFVHVIRNAKGIEQLYVSVSVSKRHSAWMWILGPLYLTL